LGLPVNDAMGTALGAVMLSAAVGVFVQRQYVLFVPALILGLTGMLSAPFGRSLATYTNELVLLLSLVGISIVIAVLMWKSSKIISEPEIALEADPKVIINVPVLARVSNLDDSLSTHEASSIARIDWLHPALNYHWVIVLSMIISGLLIGAVSGLLGIGGGVFMVPFLSWFLRINMMTAIATSMLTVLLISASGFFTSLLIHNQVDLFLTAKLSIAATIGALIGYRLGSYCQDHHLQKIFSLSLISMSFLALAKEL
jgi:uncharacterized membrane protein YfcA